MTQKVINLLVADDHRMFIEGLKYILKDEMGIQVVGFALNGKEAIDLCNKNSYHVVLMDINMPVIDGISATVEIKRLHPEIKIIMLSMLTDVNTITKALKAGADGYVLKSNSGEDLLNAFNKVLNHRIFISPTVAHYFSDESPGASGTKESYIRFSETLVSPRERDVLKLIVEGFTNREIAETLSISEKTVDTHRKNILSKLKLSNTASLVKFAIKNNLV